MSQTLLAIDDSTDIHELLAVRLSPEGLILHHARGAADGLAKASELLPDLILLDVDLDGESGFEVRKKLKEQPATAGIPIIFLTVATDVLAKVQGFDLGAVDYVVKPFDAAELRARVRATLRTKRYQDLLSARAHVDGLTGIWNRAYFDQRVREAVAAAQRGRTFALDAATGRRVLEVLDRVNRELGTSVAVVTHNAPIAQMADRVVTLADGRIASETSNADRKAPDEVSW